MSTAQPQPRSSADETISRTVEALMAYRSVTRVDICQAAHMSSSSYYNRMNGQHGWSATEVADIASALKVPVQTLYDGLPGLDDGRARRDSNAEPSDPKSDRKMIPRLALIPGQAAPVPAPRPRLTLVHGGAA